MKQKSEYSVCFRGRMSVILSCPAVLLYQWTMDAICPAPYPEILPGVGEYNTFRE
jgi:hypothetical protein